MKDPFVLFWSALLFGSILWYAFLVFYIGLKAGSEIRIMFKNLSRSQSDKKAP